jgi:hypothetical protein
MAVLLFWAVLALSLNFLCSMLEAVLLSVTPSYIAACEASEKPRERGTGRLLRDMKEAVDRPLVAVAGPAPLARCGDALAAGP